MNNIKEKALNRHEFMTFVTQNKKILNPVRRWRYSLINSCGGKEFWMEQANSRYKSDGEIKHTHSMTSIIQSLFMTNFIIMSSASFSVIKSRPFYAIRFFFSIMAFVFIVLQTSNVHLSKSVVILVRYSEWTLDCFFILEGIGRLIAIKAFIHLQNALGKPKKTLIGLLWSSGVQSLIVSIISVSFGRSVVGDWAKLCRLVLLTSMSLRRLENIDVLMVSGVD
jgi:hypothetical protein